VSGLKPKQSTWLVIDRRPEAKTRRSGFGQIDAGHDPGADVVAIDVGSRPQAWRLRLDQISIETA
jgi:hypothetical protein